MHLRLSRRGLQLAAPLSLALLLACSFGPVVRYAARTRAAKRHIGLEIRSVRPAWFAVRLLGVVARPDGMPSFQVRIDELRVGLGFGLGVDRLDLHGLAIEARGDLDPLREQIDAWRALGRPSGEPAREPSRSGPTVVL